MKISDRTKQQLTNSVGHDAAEDIVRVASQAVTYEEMVDVVGDSATLESPSFTGIPTAPTADVGTRTNQIATTEFVLANQAAGGAPLDSPSFTGTPTAPTAGVGSDTAQLATCAFVLANQSPGGAPADSPSFTGSIRLGGFGDLVGFFGADPILQPSRLVSQAVTSVALGTGPGLAVLEVVDVGLTFDALVLNNNFASVAAQVNALVGDVTELRTFVEEALTVFETMGLFGTSGQRVRRKRS